MWNLKNATNKLICKTETDSQRTIFWLPEGKDDGGGIDWEFGIDRYTLLY